MTVSVDKSFQKRDITYKDDVHPGWDASSGVFDTAPKFKPHKKQKNAKKLLKKLPLLRYNYKKEGIMEADSEIAIIRNTSTSHLCKVEQ
jgi:hypothetical protein